MSLTTHLQLMPKLRSSVATPLLLLHASYGYGYIEARTDTTQQSGQTPDKEVEIKNITVYLDGWLTVHRSITLADFQLDAQNSYLFIYNTFIKILYVFRALPLLSSGGNVVTVYMQFLVSSLSVGDCLVHRLTLRRLMSYIWSTHS